MENASYLQKRILIEKKWQEKLYPHSAGLVKNEGWLGFKSPAYSFTLAEYLQ
jgi:hypothetical protein